MKSATTPSAKVLRGQKGGRARAAALSREERSTIAKIGAKARWAGHALKAKPAPAMTPDAAKKLVCRALAATLRFDLENASGWMSLDAQGQPLSDTERQCVEEAAKKLIQYFTKKAGT